MEITFFCKKTFSRSVGSLRCGISLSISETLKEKLNRLHEWIPNGRFPPGRIFLAKYEYLLALSMANPSLQYRWYEEWKTIQLNFFCNVQVPGCKLLQLIGWQDMERHFLFLSHLNVLMKFHMSIPYLVKVDCVLMSFNVLQKWFYEGYEFWLKRNQNCWAQGFKKTIYWNLEHLKHLFIIIVQEINS